MKKAEILKKFDGCKTGEDAKKVYKTLAKILHPDCGGDTESMQILNDVFEQVFNRVKNTYKTKEGETYQKANYETAREFMDIINALINLEGLTIEVCGTWLWVSGDTKAHKDAIKAVGLKYSANKQAWYKAPLGYRKKSKEAWTMDAIHNAFGSEVIKKAKKADEESPVLALN